MSYECQIEEQSAQSTVSVRRRTSVDKLPDVMGVTYGRLMEYLESQGAHPAGPPYAGYFNMDMQDLDVEIGFPVSAALLEHGDIQSSEIPAGKVAATIHTGPYEEFGKAYEALMGFMGEQGLEGTGVAYEFYLNDPTTTPPEQLQTRILMPLR